MTLVDWLQESKTRYQTQPPTEATTESARALWRGLVRRTIDPRLGQVWWQRDDWDILVILDACRVDLAQETLTGHDVRSTWSPASTSIDWIRRHFHEEYREDWQDAAYVTANPFSDHNTPHAQSADLREKDLGYLDLVYERGFGDVDGIKTTPPETVTDAAIHAWRNEDVDRMIVHYMQPHQPFRSRPEWESVYSNLENLAGEVNEGGPDIWHRHRHGEFNRSELWQAYKDNLEWAWNDVHERLLSNVDGDVLVTSDHGNGLGEWGAWSHPPGSIVPEVRRVPVVGPFRGVDTESVTPDSCQSGEKRAGGRENSVGGQLEALGYK